MKNLEENRNSFESGIERGDEISANNHNDSQHSSIKTIYSLITNLVGTAVLVFPKVFLDAGPKK